MNKLEIVGIIVNSQRRLTHLQVKEKGSTDVKTLSLEEMKSFLKNNQVKSYHLNREGFIEGNSSASKLSNLRTYCPSTWGLRRIYSGISLSLYRLVKDEQGNIIGGYLRYHVLDGEYSAVKLSLRDIAFYYSYCIPENFMIRLRDGKYYLTGKNGQDLNKLPCDIEVSKKTNSEGKKADKSAIKSTSQKSTTSIPKKKFLVIKADFNFDGEDSQIFKVYEGSADSFIDELRKKGIKINKRINSENSPICILDLYDEDNRDYFDVIAYEFGYNKPIYFARYETFNGLENSKNMRDIKHGTWIRLVENREIFIKEIIREFTSKMQTIGRPKCVKGSPSYRKQSISNPDESFVFKNDVDQVVGSVSFEFISVSPNKVRSATEIYDSIYSANHQMYAYEYGDY